MTIKCFCFKRFPLPVFVSSGSLDCVIYIWDVIRGHSLFSLTSHTMPLTQLRFSGSLNKSLLYSTSRDSTLKVWDVTTQQLCYDLTKHAHWINTLALNTDYVREYTVNIKRLNFSFFN
jgi:ribosome assembly protein 4